MNHKLLPRALAAGVLAMATSAFAGEKIRIVSPWGDLTAVLDDNASAQALLHLLPLELPMRDHLRQEKTGRLRTPLPDQPRTRAFSNGDLGLWGDSDFVIYYADGEVPPPGIVRLGRIEGGAQRYDRPGPVTVRIEHAR